MGDLVRRTIPGVFVLLMGAIVVAAVILVDRQRREPEMLRLEFETPLRRELRVEVTGAVAAPGAYTLEAGDRVEDALAVAGGLLPDADAARLNRAALLVDGQSIRVPEAGATPVAGLVDLNTAGAEVLDSLPGVGEVRAAEIVASREMLGPFMRIEELVERGLLPASTVEELRDLVAPLP